MKKPVAPMIKVLACALLVILAVLPFISSPPSPSAAAAGINLTSSIQTSFPAAMTFNVKAQSDANIVSLRLHYLVDRLNFASVVSEGWAQFNPATRQQTNAAFGSFTGARAPRTVQLAVRLMF